MKNACIRVLDKPFFLFGLEIEDIAFLSTVVGLGSLIFGPLIPGGTGVVSWIVLWQFKRDKPPGFLLHVLYSKGVPLMGLLPPSIIGKRLSIYV